MNYFELFGLPIGFQVDAAKLRQAYMEIQRTSHPDKFTQSSIDDQDIALENQPLPTRPLPYLTIRNLYFPMYWRSWDIWNRMRNML